MKYLLLLIFTFQAMAGFPPVTLKSQSGSRVTNFNFQVPYNQATQTAAGTNLIETGNDNAISNGGFEHSTITTGWTVANGSSSSTASTPFGAAAITITASSQTSTLTSGTAGSAFSGVNLLLSAWVKTSLTNVQVCPVFNGTVSSSYCVNVSSNNTWNQYQIPVVGDATTTALIVQMSSSGTGSFSVDNAFVGVNPLGNMSSCSSNINCATVFSAKMTSTGTISEENLDWINGNCTNATPNVCTFNSSIFTVTPNCYVTTTSANQPGVITATSSSSVSVQGVVTTTGAASAAGLNIVCQKQGADYTSAVANTPSINATNADYDWTSFTCSSPNGSFGTLTSINCFHKRQGSDLLLRLRFTAGTSAGVEGRISLPNGLVIDSTKVPVTTFAQGWAQRILASAAQKNFMPLMTGGQSYITFGTVSEDQAIDSLSSRNDTNLFNSTDKVEVYARIPIQGWINNNVIIGTFKDAVQSPSTTGTPKICSFGYGGASETTVCSSGTCTLYSHVGACVSSMTFTSTGLYTINFNTGYWTQAPRCVASVLNNLVALYDSQPSTTSWTGYKTKTLADVVANSWGSIICHGY